jgi:hypothetical protein
MHMPRFLFALSGALAIAAGAALAQTPTKDTSAASSPAKTLSTTVIQALQKQTAIKSYQWTETMVVSANAKEKATVVNTCYYNADGGVSRTPVSEKASQKAGSGTGTTTEIATYVNSAVAVMRGYVRPSPERLQACQDAGRVSVTTEQDGKRQKLQYRNVMKAGDNLSLVVDPSTGQILSMAASTYVINANDRAEIHTEMSQLPDGSSYPSRITFDTPGREMGVVATNSNFRKKSS